MTDLFKEKISVEQALRAKQNIDQSQNPAMKHELKQDLGAKRVILTNVTVKKVAASSQIGYDFCVISDVTTSTGTVECYIFSSDNTTMAKLRDGYSRINAEGDFSRFFSLLDNTLMTLEITDAKITIVQ